MCDKQLTEVLQMLKIGKRQSIYLMISGAVVLIVGIILTTISSKFNKLDYQIDYTDIGNCNYEKSNMTCPDYIKTHEGWAFCICEMDFTLPMALSAPVDIYYELKSFDPSSISESRDNVQLSGVLSLTPSPSCGNYTYAETADGRKPIAPCGALADALFNDTYNVYRDGKMYNMSPGVLSAPDIIGYHNPPGNLTKALENFTKPINWHLKEWDAFLNEENGFESEKFIGWMHSDWKRKPYARINEDLLIGTHHLEVGYYYPTSRYDGQRNIILSSSQYTCYSCFPVGIIFLIIGSLVFVCGLVAILFLTKLKKESTNFSPVEQPLQR